MLGESVHPAVHHSVSVSKVTLHSFEQGRGLGSGIRTPSSQEGDRGVEKSASSAQQEILPDVLKTRNPLVISDISLIFAPCIKVLDYD